MTEPGRLLMIVRLHHHTQIIAIANSPHLVLSLHHYPYTRPHHPTLLKPMNYERAAVVREQTVLT